MGLSVMSSFIPGPINDQYVVVIPSPDGDEGGREVGRRASMRAHSSSSAH
eukprot:evm.model.NODE_5679_length_3848_cov_7.702443.1